MNVYKNPTCFSRWSVRNKDFGLYNANTTDNNTNNNTANNNTNNNNNSTTNNNTNNSTTGTGGTTNNNGSTININTPDIKYVESNGTDTKIDSSKVVKEPKFKLENMVVSALGISGNIKIVDEDIAHDNLPLKSPA